MNDSENKDMTQSMSEHKSEHKESGHKTHHSNHGSNKSMKENAHKWLLAAAVIQIILLLYIASNVAGGASGVTGAVVADNGAQPSAAAPSAPAAKIDMAALLDDDAVKGDPNAPVTIVEFSDYECPFCARFYSETLQQIDEQYIKTGKVKLIYRDFPLSFHPQAQKAAEAAECAGEQGKYYDMHDLLFEKGVQGGSASFKQYAQEIGLDTGKFNTCLDTGAMAGEVLKDFNDGQQAGIQGTPGFVINGAVVSGAQPFQVFQQIIEAELAN